MQYSELVKASIDEFEIERKVTINKETFCVLHESFDKDDESCTWLSEVQKRESAFYVICRAYWYVRYDGAKQLKTMWIALHNEEMVSLRKYFSN